jgi:hypothetical protein
MASEFPIVINAGSHLASGKTLFLSKFFGTKFERRSEEKSGVYHRGLAEIHVNTKENNRGYHIIDVHGNAFRNQFFLSLDASASVLILHLRAQDISENGIVTFVDGKSSVDLPQVLAKWQETCVVIVLRGKGRGRAQILLEDLLRPHFTNLAFWLLEDATENELSESRIKKFRRYFKELAIPPPKSFLRTFPHLGLGGDFKLLGVKKNEQDTYQQIFDLLSQTFKECEEDPKAFFRLVFPLTTVEAGTETRTPTEASTETRSTPEVGVETRSTTEVGIETRPTEAGIETRSGTRSTRREADIHPLVSTGDRKRENPLYEVLPRRGRLGVLASPPSPVLCRTRW